MSELVLTQMTKANSQSCNEFDSSMILPIKNTMGVWPDKIQDTVFKNTKASEFCNVVVKIVPLNIG